MSEKTDQKLQHVAVGRYTYRHEAEFAAGFLDDADIPYRLQIDDPGLGLTISSPATVWVRAVDVRRALDLLEIPGTEVTPSGSDRVQPHRQQKAERHRSAPVDALGTRERLLAAAGSMGLVVAAWITVSGEPMLWPTGVLVAAAAALLLVALLGRAPQLLKGLLDAFSGRAP